MRQWWQSMTESARSLIESMQWWQWSIVAAVVLLALVLTALAVQARRRRGGVIVNRAVTGPDASDSAGEQS